MSNNVAIEVQGLSKLYQLGGAESNFDTFREMLTGLAVAPFKKIRRLQGIDRDQEKIWALRDANLVIRKGDVLGIIGPNGAGKSTLLKILSRITEPTEGRVITRGRVASLLEVGTGFHPELTGRENIFLNGAILGMTRREIRARFDEIVEFAEIGRFLDTPVKRYSSGMYVRLAFAVAAHLEPEILLVDEVLAVGDMAFQRKCLGKMQDVSGAGRTVLFVSHNMAAIESLCSACVTIRGGHLSSIVEPRTAVLEYSSWSNEISSLSLTDRQDRQGEGALKLTSVEILNSTGTQTDSIMAGDAMRLRLHYEAVREFRHVRAIVGVYDHMNVGLLRFDTDTAANELSIGQGKGVVECSTEAIPVAPGNYFVNIALFDSGVMQDYVQHACSLSFVPSDYFGSGRFVTEQDARLMRVLVRNSWSVRPDNS